MLTDRRARILQFIVKEYVDSAMPVGSAALVHKYGIKASAATVRSEMMSLEEEGYLTQPHTSAGRIPSDRGYRYYVESLMEEEQLSEELKRTVRHQFYQVGPALEAWAHLAAAILARSVQNLALVTAPHPARAHLRRLELVEMGDVLVLLVVVVQEGRLREETLVLDRRLSQDDLTRTARRLNRLFGGLSAGQMEQERVELAPFEQKVIQAVIRVLRAEEESGYEPIYLEGLRNILSQPEFSRPRTMLDFLDVLDVRSLPRLIPFHWTAPDHVTFIIGAENPEDAMRQCSLVLARYGRPGGMTGALAVLGPTRLPYERATTMVRYMASLLDELVSLYYA
ncbi:MAG: heat-inducible transcriptional repressor HrcA [Dehalococcoidia bacterium]